MEITRSPLCWPDHAARTAPSQRRPALFGDYPLTHAVAEVRAEINRLNGFPWDYDDPSIIVSSNCVLNQKGSLKSAQAQPADPGVAVYFTLNFLANGKKFERPVVLTCDKWTKVQANLRAIEKDIQAQRGRARWGCGTVQQMFQGYLAIPERCGSRAWWDVLKCSPEARPRELKQARDSLAQTCHPDKGGSHELWIEIQNAFEQGMAIHR